mgnify:FL=1
MSRFDPRERGAQCDRCPLGPDGCLSDGAWDPVPPEVHESTTVAAVLEAPKRDDVKYGMPLSGLDGAEWDRALKANGLHRTMIDLFFVIACSPRDGWKKMEATLRRKRKAAQKKLQKAGSSAAEAKRQVEVDLPHPADCCAPYLQRMLSAYGYIIPMGSTPAQRVLDTSSSMAHLEGDMREVKASRLTWQAFDWTQSKDDWTVKVISTYDPGYVKHAPKVRPQFYATLGKAFRWFNNALNWLEPETQEQPTPDELREWLAVPAPFWVYDYETDGINVLDIGVRCLAIATPDVDAHGHPTMPYETPAQVARTIGINIMGTDRIGRRFYSPSDEEQIKDILREFFVDETKVKVGHNAGYFDRQVTEHWLGVRPMPTHDTLFDARFTHPDLPKGLKPTGRRLTDVHKWETSESGEKNSGSKVSDQERLTYCEYDTVVNARITEPLRRSADDNGANKPLPEWAKPVSWPSATPWTLRNLDHARQDMCVQMHQNGVYVDQGKAAILTDRFERVAKDLYAELQGLTDVAGVKKRGNQDFNPGSFDQVRNLLYEQWDLGIPYGMDAREFYTESGLPGTGDAVLRAHMASPDINEAQRKFLLTLRQYRRVRTKVLGTQLYTLRPLKDGGAIHPDGRVRSTWNSHTTAVGRLSSSGPNMQNQSSRKDLGGVRTLYCAAPGNVLVGCDLSAAHLVITANYWGVQRLLDCFADDLDPHCWLAHDLFGKDFEQASGWTKGFSLKATHKPSKKGKAGQLRELIKTYRYASIYWASAETKHSVIRSTELTGFKNREDGSEYLHTDLPYLKFDLNQVRFFDKVWHESEPDWMQAWQQMLMLYSKQGYMEDPLFGRRSGGLQEGKKNEVVNYPVLACEAAVMAIAEQRVLETFPFQKWGPGTGLTAQVHDSLVVEVPEHLAEWAQKKMTECMTIKVPGWPVTFACEADVGRTWAEV